MDFTPNEFLRPAVRRKRWCDRKLDRAQKIRIRCLKMRRRNSGNVTVRGEYKIRYIPMSCDYIKSCLASLKTNVGLSSQPVRLADNSNLTNSEYQNLWILDTVTTLFTLFHLIPHYSFTIKPQAPTLFKRKVTILTRPILNRLHYLQVWIFIRHEKKHPVGNDPKYDTRRALYPECEWF